MDPELAQLSRTVDSVSLGRRIRSARLAAGLTQAEAAEGRVSAAYISRIEIGNRRPDTKLLTHLAERLGTTVEALVSGVSRDQVAEAELTLDYAELSVKSGDAEAALQQAESVLEGESLMHVPTVLERARRVRADALESLGHHDQAIRQLEEMAAASRQDASWLRVLISLSRCYRETGDLVRAVEVGHSALSEVDQLELAGTDEAIQLALTVAAASYERGDVDYALRLCQETVDKAEQLASPTARASAYWNASLMQTRQGAVAAAMPLARKAIEIMEQSEDARNLARLRGALASIQLRQDPPNLDGAAANAAQALSGMQWSEASAVDQWRVRLTLAKIDYLAGRSDEARDGATTCFEGARDQAPLLAAEAAVVLGRIELAADDRAGARGHFQTAVLILTAIGADRKAAEMWYELGALLVEAGDEAGALDAYRRAGASTGLTTPTGLGLAAARPPVEAG